jgi:hypothetical protein
MFSEDAVSLFPDVAPVHEDLGTFVAPGGGEFLNFSYAVSGNTITVTNVFPFGKVSWTPATFNGYEFTDVTRDPGITGISLDPATDAAGVTISDASFTSDSVAFNFQGQIWASNTSAVFDVSFGSPVPEASTWAMLLVGLSGLGFARFRSRNAPLTA